MSEPNCTLLYVADPIVSAAFYAGVLGKPAVETSPNFAMFVLESGVSLGLWAAHDAQPPATAVGGSELAFSVGDDGQVDQLHTDWHALGLTIIQAPTRMDFGYTFVATDPDGHRLRVFAPASN